MIGPEQGAALAALREAVEAVKAHNHLGFYDWTGIGPLVDAADSVLGAFDTDLGVYEMLHRVATESLSDVMTRIAESSMLAAMPPAHDPGRD